METFNTFWYGSQPNRLVRLAFKSWKVQGHDIVVWTLGEEYDFGIEVTFKNLNDYVDEIPMELLYAQKKPFSNERYIAGFVDWCRYKIMSIVPDCIIMDCDVILLKPWNPSKPTLVCEESFRIENELDGLYPCAGIIRSDNELGDYLASKSLEIAYDGMEHGTLMKLIYKRMVSDKQYYDTFDKVEHNQFFELGYDELDLFYSTISKSTIRRLKDVTGIHCWMSLLDINKSFEKGNILSILETYYNSAETFSYDLLKLSEKIVNYEK